MLIGEENIIKAMTSTKICLLIQFSYDIIFGTAGLVIILSESGQVCQGKGMKPPPSNNIGILKKSGEFLLIYCIVLCASGVIGFIVFAMKH